MRASVPVLGHAVAVPVAGHPLHRLQSAAGNRAVQRFVKSLGDPVPARPRDREAQERTTLLVLAGQVARMTETSLPATDQEQMLAFQTEIAEHLKTGGWNRAAINDLIGRVARFIPDRQEERGLDQVALTEEDRPVLTGAFDKARGLLAHVEDDCIDALFGKAAGAPKPETVRAQVRKTLQAIDKHLCMWWGNPNRYIRVDRIGTNTLNSGFGAASMLILASGFKGKDNFARTLIHEASHGCAHTLDHAYSGVSYFARLPYVVALNNADSYAFVTDKAALTDVLESPRHSEAFRLVERACYVASANWKHANWLIDSYAQARRPQGRKTGKWHALELGFKDTKNHLDLRMEHVAVLRDFFYLAGAYLRTGCEVSVDADTRSLSIAKDDMTPLLVHGFLDMNMDKQVDALLRAVARSRGLPAEFGETKWSRKLFRRFFLESKRSKEDKAMWTLMGGTADKGKGKEREKK